MNNYISFFKKSFTLTIGIILTLISLSCLVSFYTGGFDFEYYAGEFIAFIILFLVGFPTMVYGVNILGELTPNK